MKRKRQKRCPYCGELFWPDPRTAWRQWACSKGECQAERRKETQRRYRAKNAGDAQARRYRDEIAKVKNGVQVEVAVPRGSPIFTSQLWDEIRDEIKDEIKPQSLVTLAFIVELIFRAVRDEILSQSPVNPEEIGKYRGGDVKDEIAQSGPSP